MNIFDIVIIIILSFCLIRGFFRGFIKEVSSIIGILGGFYAAYTYYPLGEAYLLEEVMQTSYANVISFTAIFIGVFIIITILGIIIRFFLDIVFLGWVDCVCGACFGLLKGVLFTSVLLVVLTTFLSDESRMIKESKLSMPVSQWSETLIQIVPDNVKEAFLIKMKSIKEAWNEQSN
ncbi:MAG: hypothetical protein B6I31_03875 [Desulfobacteraceae bacterium 4572_19]|nr:MAG: hypothetical protein B6I31_03875 [Desulfobacteraceae bacterium 4572_19]